MANHSFTGRTSSGRTSIGRTSSGSDTKLIM
jgi:hypothetical protein